MIGLIFSLLLLACGSKGKVDKKPPVAKVAPFHYNPVSISQKEYYHEKLSPLYTNLLVNSNFNGGIVVAKNGEIVFEDYQGVENTTTKTPISANTKFHIASISKTFTAMAVLQLAEQHKIDINADVKTYLPNFPYSSVTVKELLCHRSGLPNYVHLMGGTVVELVQVKGKRGRIYTKRIFKKDTAIYKYATNNDVLQFLIDKHPPIEALPNTKFKYCNTNFALLALIVEKVTGTDFPTYMQQTIFKPLGMNNTFIFSIKDTANYMPSYKYNFVPYALEKLDCVYGDKNVYSTTHDLLLWDNALYNNKIVSPESLEMAYTPYSFEKPGTHNYGLGWRLFTFPGNTIPYHNGWWHGNNAVFTRLVKDTATIIVLGNKYNQKIYKAKEFVNVFATTPNDTLQIDEP